MKRIVLTIAVLLFYFAAIAQPFNLKKEIKPVELNLINFNPKDVKKKGKINISKVVQVKDTAYYFVKKLSIYSPIVVSVGAADPSNPVQVSLHKWNWKNASRPAKQTNEKGYWEEKFSTESDFGIMVVAPSLPSEYKIYVWVGDEVSMKIPAPFKPYTGSSAGNLFSVKNILIAVGLLFFSILAILKLKKSKMNKVASLFFLFAFLQFNLASAQDEDPSLGELVRNSQNVNNAAARASVIQNSPSDINELLSFPGASMPDQGTPRQSATQRAGQEFENASNAVEHVGNFVGAITTIAGIIESGSDLWNAAAVLDAGECTPDFTQPANALIPSSCSGASGCNDCYKAALDGFNADRKTLARMMCIFMNNKNFTDKAIAFGNSMASLPGGVGLGWIPAKRMIDNAFTSLKNTYDKKSRELLISLQKNMMKIDQCENSFGLKDWYQRFGFMYFEFMQQKYKRPN